MYDAEEIGLSPGGTGEPWKGLKQGDDTTRFACGRVWRARVEIFQGKITRSGWGRGEGGEQAWAFVGQKQQNLMSAGTEKEGESQTVCSLASQLGEAPVFRTETGAGEMALAQTNQSSLA